MPEQSAKPIAAWNTARDCWEAPEIDLLFGLSDVYSETFPISGSMRNGVVYELPTSGHHMDGLGSSFSQLGGKLLPSPVAQPSGNSPDDHLRKKPGREVVTDLAIIVENGLLETGGQLLPTPNTMEHLPARTGEARERQLRRGGRPDASRRQSMGNLREDILMLPTPRATRGGSNTEIAYGFGGERTDEHREQGTIEIPEDSGWGPYAAAIHRWEHLLGRPAPDPTEEGPKGGRRLSARFVEWMMGLPAGWVTGLPPAIPEGATAETLTEWKANTLTRTQQLKMLGNGVVPQQAIYALTLMGAHEGV